MDDARISQLNEAAPLSGDEYVPITQRTGITQALKTVRTSPADIADYVLSQIIPPGTMMTYAGVLSALEQPHGWLVCDGRALSRTTYHRLFSVIGTTYGSSNDALFNLPDLRGRVVMGYNTTSSTYQPAFGNWPAGSTLSVGKLSGEFFHQLTIGELPAHNHNLTDPGHTHSVYDPRVGTHEGVRGGDGTGSRKFASVNYPTHNQNAGSSTTGISIANAGSNRYHNNMQPYIALNYIIKY